MGLLGNLAVCPEAARNAFWGSSSEASGALCTSELTHKWEGESPELLKSPA